MRRSRWFSLRRASITAFRFKAYPSILDFLRRAIGFAISRKKDFPRSRLKLAVFVFHDDDAILIFPPFINERKDK